MTQAPHPEILSAALFEQDERVLAAHRKAGCAPLAGQWLLPLTRVGGSETAETAVRRYAREQFGVEVARESFVDTVYLDDPADQQKYVANIFRADLEGGRLRFRADGDYDDVRWLAAAELEQLWMPPPLRESLLRILSEPEEAADLNWTDTAPAAAVAPAVPLAERRGEAEAPPAPDNRAAWDAMSKSYQAEHYGDRDAGRIKWTRALGEEDLQLLGDVRGMRALVLGCGGGQDVVALDRMGAVAVGIDISSVQLAYARSYAGRHGATNASFAECDIADLSRFDDASFDLAISLYAMDYVEDIDRALHECARVLRPAGVLAIAVPHPLEEVISERDAARLAHPYRDGVVDFDWGFEDGTSARLRGHVRTVTRWFEALSSAGFATERMLEPDDLEHRPDARVPYALIIKARKRA